MNTLITLSLTNIISLIFGLFTGFGIFSIILWKIKYQHLIKPTKTNLIYLSKSQQDDLKEIINKKYNEYLQYNKKKHRKEKKHDSTLLSITTEAKNIIDDVPGIVYPESENPKLELNIEQILLLLDYFPKRIRELIKIINIDGFENLKIATIISLITLSKKFYKISTARILRNIIRMFNILFMIRNILYLPYWLKKGTGRSLSKTFSNMIIYSFFDLLAYEIALIYSQK